MSLMDWCTTSAGENLMRPPEDRVDAHLTRVLGRKVGFSSKHFGYVVVLPIKSLLPKNPILESPLID